MISLYSYVPIMCFLNYLFFKCQSHYKQRTCLVGCYLLYASLRCVAPAHSGCPRAHFRNESWEELRIWRNIWTIYTNHQSRLTMGTKSRNNITSTLWDIALYTFRIIQQHGGQTQSGFTMRANWHRQTDADEVESKQIEAEPESSDTESRADP